MIPADSMGLNSTSPAEGCCNPSQSETSNGHEGEQTVPALEAALSDLINDKGDVNQQCDPQDGMPSGHVISSAVSFYTNGADLVPSPSLEQAREFARHSKAENTLRGYRSDWRHFCAWCESHHLGPLPAAPEVVAS